MPDPYDRLTILAQDLLDETVAILETTPSGAPASRFLTPARPAFDCEFVAVQVSRLTEDTTRPLEVTSRKKRKHFGNIILATMLIYVVRCAPMMKGLSAPSDQEKTLSAQQIQEDAWSIWNGVRTAQDDLFDACLGVYFDGGLPIPESGGYVGWQFQIRVSIDGYEAVIST